MDWLAGHTLLPADGTRYEVGDRVLVTECYGSGGALVEARPDGTAAEVWRNPTFGLHFMSALQLGEQVVVQVSHRFYFGMTGTMPRERDRFQTTDGIRTFEIMFVDRPLNHYQMCIADLIELEKPASVT